MLRKINRQEALNKYRVFPLRGYDEVNDEETFFYPPIYKRHILTLSSKSFKGHSKLLGIELTKLSKQLGWDTLLFLGDTELGWLHQENDYKPAQAAQLYLRDNKVGKRFNGALQIHNTEMATFIRHLAWLTPLQCFITLLSFYWPRAKRSWQYLQVRKPSHWHTKWTCRRIIY